MAWVTFSSSFDPNMATNGGIIPACSNKSRVLGIIAAFMMDRSILLNTGCGSCGIRCTSSANVVGRANSERTDGSALLNMKMISAPINARLILSALSLYIDTRVTHIRNNQMMFDMRYGGNDVRVECQGNDSGHQRCQ